AGVGGGSGGGGNGGVYARAGGRLRPAAPGGPAVEGGDADAVEAAVGAVPEPVARVEVRAPRRGDAGGAVAVPEHDERSVGGGEEAGCLPLEVVGHGGVDGAAGGDPPPDAAGEGEGGVAGQAHAVEPGHEQAAEQRAEAGVERL